MEKISGLRNIDHVVNDLGEFLFLVLADHRVAAESET